MKKFRPIAVFALVCIIACLLVPNILASTQPLSKESKTIPQTIATSQASVDDLTQLADSILVGTVKSLNSYWNEEHTRIFTDVRVSVETPVKGALGSEIVVKMPGGSAGGLTELVSAAPLFVVGERDLLFLKSELDGTNSLASWNSGKQTIVNDTAMPFNIPLTNVINEIARTTNEPVPSSTPKQEVIYEASFVLPAPLTKTSVTTQAVSTLGWNNIMTEDFEGTFPGVKWTLSGNPTWGQTSSFWYHGTYTTWCARGGSLGYDPANANYANNMNAWMVYGPFTLSGYSDAELNFYYYNKTDLGGFDGLVWCASIDGQHFYGPKATTNSAGWVYNSFDLTTVPSIGNITGQTSVWIAFIFQSDSYNVAKGAFLDDIVLRGYVPTLTNISSVTPSSASAGTGNSVTIIGTNFGATQGSSIVTFYNRTGQPRIQATILSWSDSSIVATVPMGASSGPVIVTTVTGDSNGYQFGVTFGYMGVKWPGVSPRVSYRVNSNTPDTTLEELAVKSAASTWSTVAGADFQFIYAGTSSATQYSLNGVNEVLWRNLGTTGTVSVTYTWFDGSGNIVEFDTELNDSYTWSDVGVPGAYDILNTATHELGHALGLKDLYGDIGSPNDTEKTMYGIVATQETKKKTLEAGDQAGIIWLYPASVVPTPTPTPTPVPTPTPIPTPTPTPTPIPTPTPTPGPGQTLSIPLSQGLNFIAGPDRTMSVTEALASISGKYLWITTYDPFLSPSSRTYVPSNTGASNLLQMDRLHGYQIFTTQSAILTYPQ